MPAEYKDTTLISEALVEQEDAKFLTLLEHVFGECDFAAKPFEQAEGSGTSCLRLLKAQSRKRTACSSRRSSTTTCVLV